MQVLLSYVMVVFFLISGIPAVALAADKAPENAVVSENIVVSEFKQETITIETAAKATHSIKAEIAESQEAREKGLQGRTEMPADRGMLFIFSEDTFIEMWMKNTPMSLDMLFLDSKGKIIYIAAKTKPNSLDIISARKDARGVLELAGGTTEKLGIKIGDRVIYSYFK